MMTAFFILGFTLSSAQAATPSSLLEEIKALEPYRKHLVAENRPDISDQDYLSALGGQPVSGIVLHEGIDAGQGWGVRVYDHPVDRVWSSITHEEVMDGKMSLDVSTVLEGPEHAHGRLIFQTLDLPRPLTDRYWVTQVSHGAEAYKRSRGRLWEVSWSDVTKTYSLAKTEYASYEKNGTALEWTKGAWTLIPLSDGRTVVEYFAWSDPGGYIPPAIAARLAPGQVLKTLEEMEQIVREQREGPFPSKAVKPDGSSLR